MSRTDDEIHSISKAAIRELAMIFFKWAGIILALAAGGAWLVGDF